VCLWAMRRDVSKVGDVRVSGLHLVLWVPGVLLE